MSERPKPPPEVELFIKTLEMNNEKMPLSDRDKTLLSLASFLRAKLKITVMAMAECHELLVLIERGLTPGRHPFVRNPDQRIECEACGQSEGSYLHKKSEPDAANGKS